MNRPYPFASIGNVRLFCVVLLALAAPAGAEAARSTAPATPIRAEIAIDTLAGVGQPVRVSCTVESLFDAPGVLVTLELPDNARAETGETGWIRSLAAGDRVSLDADVVFTSAGETSLFCRALYVRGPRSSWGDLAELHLTVGEERSELGFRPVPAERRDVTGVLEPGGEGEGELVAPARAAYPAPPPAPEPPGATEPELVAGDPAEREAPETPAGDLTITGRWRFVNRDGVSDSEQMLVEIVRGDNGSHLAWCFTDAAGYYTCGPFTNPGVVGVRSRFLSYTSFNPNPDVLVAVNPDVGTAGTTANAYAFVTPIQTFADGSHDIGAWLVPGDNNNRRAYWIVADLIETWKYVYFAVGLGQTNGPCTVQWKISSTDGTYYDWAGNVHLDGSDPLSDTVVAHEYGHNGMWTNYGGYLPPNDCPSPHYIELAGGPTCAWVEGWADFLPMAVNNDPFYRWDSGGELNLETPSWTTPVWEDGDQVEGRVAGALWDILDAANDGDDQYSDPNGLDALWDTYYNQNDTAFVFYWAAWLSRGHDNSSAGPIMDLFQNTIEYRVNPSNDDYGSAIGISGAATSYAYYNLDTTGATTQGLDPQTRCGSLAAPRQSRSVWWSFTPNSTYGYTLDTEGSNYDTVLSVTRGGTAFTPAGCDDDDGTGLLSSLTVFLQGGVNYRIEVLRYGNLSGGILDFSLTRLSSNLIFQDDFEGHNTDLWWLTQP